MKVFIEKSGGELRGVNEYVAFRGFEALGAEIEFFEVAELDSLDLNAQTPLVAGIPRIWRALGNLGAEIPHLKPIPAGLEAFAGRESGICTLYEIRQRIIEEGPPIFIKPMPHQGKLFNGHVLHVYRDLLQTVHLEGQILVSWSQFVDFIGEFRGFVHDGELVGFRHYAGDFRASAKLDFAPVEAALNLWESAPRGCSMDWGVTADGRTLLIEVNDGYSLGSYGLAPHLYAPLLADRWREMAGAAT